MSEINAIRFAEPWQVSCVKIPMPEPKPGEALIKIMAAGICGSDIGAFRGTNGLVSYPRVIGHELAGVVVSIPENNKNGIKVGDRVVVDPYLYCGHCYPLLHRPHQLLRQPACSGCARRGRHGRVLLPPR